MLDATHVLLGYTTELIVEDDSLTLRSLKGDELERQDVMFLGKNNEIRKKGRTLDVSKAFPYEKSDESETYYMTFTRNGNRIELTGDKQLVGVINDDRSEIEFEDLGSFGRK